MLKILIGSVLTASLLTASAAGSPVAFAETPISEICTATSIEEVDELLDNVVDSELLEVLDGLLELKVPVGDDELKLDSSVSLEDIKKDLNCDSDKEENKDKKRLYKDCAEVRRLGKAPVSKNDDRFRASLDLDGDGVGCETNGDDSPSRKSSSTDDNDSRDSSRSSSSSNSQVSRIPVGAPETGGA